MNLDILMALRLFTINNHIHIFLVYDHIQSYFLDNFKTLFLKDFQTV
jgi:hypothetical protein